MAGHNKWSKIKHKKGAADAKRSKVWTKIIREITVAVRMSGNDPDSNPRLRKGLDEAKTANMPKDTINRAIAKGEGPAEGADYAELTYEGYGPAGIAILVDCLSDNRNRTSTEVRVAFNKNGGNLGSAGSVSFGFKKKGEFAFSKNKPDGTELTEDELMEVGLEAGVEDIENGEEGFIATSAADAFHSALQAFEKNGLKPLSSELAMVPDTTVSIDDSTAQKLEKIIDALEDLDDVQNVWTNAA